MRDRTVLPDLSICSCVSSFADCIYILDLGRQEGDDVGGTCAKALQKEGKHLPAWVWLPWAPSFILHHRQQYHCIAPFQDILLNVSPTTPLSRHGAEHLK
jgi:hypothetical protein